MRGPFNSTDFSAIHLHSLDIDQPELTMTTEGNQQAVGAAKGFAIPLTFTVQELSVNGAKINLTTKKDSATKQLQTVIGGC